MNRLDIGDFDIKPPAHCLVITDALPLQRYRRANIFDPRKDHVNVFKDMDDASAWDLSDVLYSIEEEAGKSTLTRRDGQLELAEAFKDARSFTDMGSDNEEVQKMLRRVLFFKVVREMVSVTKDVFIRGKLKKVGTEFAFNKRNITFAILDRKELGPRAALICGLLLLNAYKGQVVVKDFDFYGRDAHIRLIEEERLIAHVRTLKNLSPKLRANLLLMKNKNAKNANFEDAEELARTSKFIKGQEGYTDFIQRAMGIVRSPDVVT